MQNPWLNLPETAPFVLVEDEQIILEYNQSLLERETQGRS
jgi:hypothetical protein